VKFTSADQILFRCAGEGTVGEFAFDLEVDSGLWVRLVYANNPGAGIAVTPVQFREGQGAPVRVIRAGMASEEIEALLPEALVKLGKEGRTGKGSGWHWGVARERFYLGFNLRGDDSRTVVLFPGGKVVSPIEVFLTHIAGILFLHRALVAPGLGFSRARPGLAPQRGGFPPARTGPGSSTRRLSTCAHWAVFRRPWSPCGPGRRCGCSRRPGRTRPSATET
jgi:hypothetical protein